MKNERKLPRNIRKTPFVMTKDSQPEESSPGGLKKLSLVKHYLRRLGHSVALVQEYGRGAISFLGWAPHLLRNIARLYPFGFEANETMVKSSDGPALSEIPTYYINLERRTDRRKLVEAELKSIGALASTRFVAVENSLGILGCTRSHIGVLEMIEKSGSALSLVCEDDVEFLVDPPMVQSLIREFAGRRELDVLCLAYRLRAPRLRVSQTLAVANSIQTASCYVVRQRAVGTLLKSYRESESMLERGVLPKVAANDMHWKIAQTQSLFFSIPSSPLARQRPSFSDIAGRFKDYGA
jgi:hypothetical protein